MLAAGKGVDMMMNYPWEVSGDLKMLFSSQFSRLRGYKIQTIKPQIQLQ